MVSLRSFSHAQWLVPSPRRQLFILAAVRAVRSCADSSQHVFRRRGFGDLFARLYHRLVGRKRSHTRQSSSCRLDLTFLSGLCVVEKRRTMPGQPRPIRSEGLGRCAKLSRTPRHTTWPAGLHGSALQLSYSDQLARPDLVAFQRPAQVPLVPRFSRVRRFIYFLFFFA